MPALEQNRPQERSNCWQSLKIHHHQIKNICLRQLFDHDPRRGERLKLEGCGIYFDFSKNLITRETIDSLQHLAESCGLGEKIEQRFSLEKTASSSVPAHGDMVMDFTKRVWSGAWTGHTGMRLRNFIIIEVSPEEPDSLLAHHAIGSFANSNGTTQFVTGANHREFCNMLKQYNPAETLFIVCSESFTSRETMACAHKARRWILKAMRDESAVARHFAAVTGNLTEASRFGIEAGATFGFWNRLAGDLVATSSVIGFATAMALGPEVYSRMMNGFHCMDEHVKSEPFDRNMPIVWGLLGVWYSSFFGSDKLAILPSNRGLTLLPHYLKRLVTKEGARRIADPGNGIEADPLAVQSRFCQRIMHGTAICPCDFIGFCAPEEGTSDQHNLLMAKMLASPHALAFGQHVQSRPDSTQVIEGNHPSNTILLEKLTPETFGSLLCFYEHGLFTQEAIGRELFAAPEETAPLNSWAEKLVQEIENNLPAMHHDSSTSCLIRHYRSVR